MELSKFEKKCLALAIGYDNSVCDGKYCERKLDCIRYMIYKKAILEEFPRNLYYIQKKYNDECYWKYGQEDKQENR